MIDTISYHITGTLKESVQEALERKDESLLHPDWTFSRVEWKKGFTAHSLKREKGGLQISVLCHRKLYIRVSLPKLFFGSNFRLLRNQGEINMAHGKLWNLVSEVITPEDGFSRSTIRHVSRLHLVWHIPGTKEQWKPLLATASTKHYRQPGRGEYKGGYELGREGKSKIMFYDKVLKELGKSGDFTRVEVQLDKPRIPNDLGLSFADDSENAWTLDFKSCYSLYRKILLSLSLASPRPGEDTRMVQFLAELESTGLKDGSSPLERYIALKSPGRAYQNRLRREVNQRLTALKGILPMESLLPEKRPLSLPEANQVFRGAELGLSSEPFPKVT